MNTQSMKSDDTDADADASIDNESSVPTSAAVIHLLLAREGDRVALVSETDAEDALSESDAEDEWLFDVAEIAHERNLDEKVLRLTQPDGETRVAHRVSRDERVISFIDGKPDSTSAIADTFRVVNRPLGITSETWEPRERDLPVERYREVRIDEAARPALVRLVGWLAGNLTIDERTGNGSWRENRDEVLATAYRLQQPSPADSFTIETVTLDIVRSALKAARWDESGDGGGDGDCDAEPAGDSPFSEAFLAAMDEQIESPGLEDWDGVDDGTTV